MPPKNKKAAVNGSGASNVYFLTPDSLEHTPRGKPKKAVRIADDPVMQTAFQRVYDQGPRLCLELLSTLAEKNMQTLAVEKEIKHFALLPPGALRAIGGDQVRHHSPDAPK